MRDVYVIAQAWGFFVCQHAHAADGTIGTYGDEQLYIAAVTVVGYGFKDDAGGLLLLLGHIGYARQTVT